MRHSGRNFKPARFALAWLFQMCVSDEQGWSRCPSVVRFVSLRGRYGMRLSPPACYTKLFVQHLRPASARLAGLQGPFIISAFLRIFNPSLRHFIKVRLIPFPTISFPSSLVRVLRATKVISSKIRSRLTDASKKCACFSRLLRFQWSVLDYYAVESAALVVSITSYE